MQNSDFTLGQALAHLKASQFESFSIALKKNQNINYKDVNQLKDKFNTNDDTAEVEGVFASVPNHACHSDSSYLQINGERFFKFYLLMDPVEDNCAKIMKHLNDCYPCFDIYTHVMRDYYYQYEKLKKLD